MINYVNCFKRLRLKFICNFECSKIEMINLIYVVLQHNWFSKLCFDMREIVDGYKLFEL